MPRADTYCAQGTGEPDDAKVSCPVRRGTGRKGSNDLARGLPYLLRRSRFRQQVSASVSCHSPTLLERNEVGLACISPRKNRVHYRSISPNVRRSVATVTLMLSRGRPCSLFPFLQSHV
jgi:hypothetical protein